MEYFTIGQFAKYCGTTVEFLKFYEREGLLAPIGKDDAGHRLYASYQTVELAELYKLSRMGFQLKQAKLIQKEYSLDDYETCLLQQKGSLEAEITEKTAALHCLEKTITNIRKLHDEDSWVIQPMAASYFCLSVNLKNDPANVSWWKRSPELPEYWQRIGWSPEIGVYPNNDSHINGYGWGALCDDPSQLDSINEESVVVIPAGRCLLYWYTVPSEYDTDDAHLIEKFWSLDKPLALLKAHHFVPRRDIYKQKLFVTHQNGIPYQHFMVRIPLL